MFAPWWAWRKRGAELTGAESQNDTGEPHAVDGEPQPLNMQAISHCYMVDYLAGEDHTIEKPAQYHFWRSYQADFLHDKLLSWITTNPITLEARNFTSFPGEGLQRFWTYPGIIDQVCNRVLRW